MDRCNVFDMKNVHFSINKFDATPTFVACYPYALRFVGVVAKLPQILWLNRANY